MVNSLVITKKCIYFLEILKSIQTYYLHDIKYLQYCHNFNDGTSNSQIYTPQILIVSLFNKSLKLDLQFLGFLSE